MIQEFFTKFKYNAILLVLLIVILVLLNMVNLSGNNDSEDLFKIALQGFSTEIYVFQLQSNRNLIIRQGGDILFMVDDDYYDGGGYIELLQYQETKLSEDQFDTLLAMLNDDTIFEPPERKSFDTWNITALIDGKIIYSTYGLSKDGKLDDIVTMLIEISPIAIVDSSGQKVMPR